VASAGILGSRVPIQKLALTDNECQRRSVPDPLDTVVFPDTDVAAIARGHGFEAATVREVPDLAAVRAWLDGGPTGPFPIDAQVVDTEPSWWLEEAFRGH
jgi:hypothetical protein